MGVWHLNQGPREARTVGTGRVNSCTSLPPSRLGSPTCLDSGRACHGAPHSPLHPPGCQRSAPSPPNPRGRRGERERGGGSERPGIIKAAGTAQPARPRRPDPLSSPPHHVTPPTTQLRRSESGRVPIHPQTLAEPPGLLNPVRGRDPMKEGADMGGTRPNLDGRNLGPSRAGRPGSPSLGRQPPFLPRRGAWETASHPPGMRVQPFPW